MIGSASWATTATVNDAAPSSSTARSRPRGGNTLPPAERIAFFRGLGRSYGVVGGLSLLVALGTGAALLGGRTWSATLTITTLAAATLVVATVVGVVQARRMTRLRHALLAGRTTRSSRVRSVQGPDTPACCARRSACSA